MSKNITYDFVYTNDDINKNVKPFINEQPIKPIIKECCKKELPIKIKSTKEEIEFDYFPLTTLISEPALNASNPQIHSDSQSQNNCCLCCACFICFIPAIVVDIISCPARLCYNKLF